MGVWNSPHNYLHGLQSVQWVSGTLLVLPQSVLRALAAPALLWGWFRVSAILFSAWCGLLRLSEILDARRRNLVLPQDVNYNVDFALLTIDKPKTRRLHIAASVQSSRIEPADVVDALDHLFGALPPDAPLWPASSDNFRRGSAMGSFFSLPMIPDQRASFGE